MVWSPGKSSIARGSGSVPIARPSSTSMPPAGSTSNDSTARCDSISETAVSEIESQRAVLSFEVEPAGGMLVLDGRAIGTLPLPRAMELLPGDHTIEIRLDRHVTRRDTLTLRPHQ